MFIRVFRLTLALAAMAALSTRGLERVSATGFGVFGNAERFKSLGSGVVGLSGAPASLGRPTGLGVFTATTGLGVRRGAC